MSQLTITQDGKVLTETHDGVTMPADYSFATVNDYVHNIERTYEDLECLCLGMACHAEKLESALLWTLYHHQGANSTIGQPIRKLIGIGRFERLTDEQLEKAKSFGEGGAA